MQHRGASKASDDLATQKRSLTLRKKDAKRRSRTYGALISLLCALFGIVTYAATLPDQDSWLWATFAAAAALTLIPAVLGQLDAAREVDEVEADLEILNEKTAELAAESALGAMQTMLSEMSALNHAAINRSAAEQQALGARSTELKSLLRGVEFTVQRIQTDVQLVDRFTNECHRLNSLVGELSRKVSGTWDESEDGVAENDQGYLDREMQDKVSRRTDRVRIPADVTETVTQLASRTAVKAVGRDGDVGREGALVEFPTGSEAQKRGGR